MTLNMITLVYLINKPPPPSPTPFLDPGLREGFWGINFYGLQNLKYHVELFPQELITLMCT